MLRIVPYEQASRNFPKRCRRKVRQQPMVGSIPESREYCRHLANYKVDGTRYCRQHAAEICLIVALENQPENN